MELNNGVLIFLALSLHLLSFSANARISSDFEAPAPSPAAPISNHVSVVPAGSPSESTPSPPDLNSPSSGESEMLHWFKGEIGLVKSHFPFSSVRSELVKICDVTSDPQLCANSIGPHLHGSVDPVLALKTEIQLSIKEIEVAITKLKEIRSHPSTSSFTIECLDTCHENFGSAIDDLKAAMESIHTHDIGTMESVLAAVMTDLSTCDDTFAELGVESPLDNLTTKMSKYASNCLAISKLLL